ncbi:hypothetical protein PC122_g20236 [Phytophthora cactorum]|nr:hypothetical protein PC122_g20236 [Phytophthora cactorum]
MVALMFIIVGFLSSESYGWLEVFPVSVRLYERQKDLTELRAHTTKYSSPSQTARLLLLGGHSSLQQFMGKLIAASLALQLLWATLAPGDDNCSGRSSSLKQRIEQAYTKAGGIQP